MRQPGAADKSQSATEVGLWASLAFARVLAWRCALISQLQLSQVPSSASMLSLCIAVASSMCSSCERSANAAPALKSCEPLRRDLWTSTWAGRPGTGPKIWHMPLSMSSG